MTAGASGAGLSPSPMTPRSHSDLAPAVLVECQSCRCMRPVEQFRGKRKQLVRTCERCRTYSTNQNKAGHTLRKALLDLYQTAADADSSPTEPKELA